MQQLETAPDVLTPDQAAAYLQVHRETVYRYIREGKLIASRLGRSYRIPRRNLELLLLATSTYAPARLRTYTDEQIAQFLEDDVLDGEALEVARRFDQATGGKFFKGAQESDKANPAQ